MNQRESTEVDRILAHARGGGEELPLGDVALALAFRNRSPSTRSSLDWYQQHIGELAEAVAAAARGREAADAPSAASVLSDVLAGTYGYVGDHDTYDDPDNADLARVIDRRRGLPVALGILYIEIARRQGWQAHGLNFPGHFLLRLTVGGDRAIVDPFHGGMVRGPGSLRALVKLMRGAGGELMPRDYAPVADRDILVRLVSNTRIRALQADRHREALDSVVSLQALIADDPLLWRESGILRARLGEIRGAITDFEHFLAFDGTPDPLRHEAAIFIERLKTHLD